MLVCAILTMSSKRRQKNIGDTKVAERSALRSESHETRFNNFRHASRGVFCDILLTMIQQNIVVLSIKSIAIDIVGDVLYFPIWWYTTGLKHIVMNRIRSLEGMSDQLALRLLLLNIFKPMFAQSDSAGRIISFFMRIVILIARSIFFFVFSMLQMLIILIWIGLPVLIFYRLEVIYLGGYARI